MVKLACRLAILTILLAILVQHYEAAASNVAVPQAHTPLYGTTLQVQAFLDNQPGVLKSYTDDGQTAATIIESSSLYYGLSPHLHLALLETVHSLLSDPNPSADALRQPFGPAGPDGFSAQIEWASQELRAGLGPYDQPPTIQFTDGTTMTLALDQAMEGVAMQRFLAIGRTADEWQALNQRFVQVFEDYFHNQMSDLFSVPALDTPDIVNDGDRWEKPAENGFLYMPWPDGTNVFHLAYFDHVYPTVDSGSDGNDIVMTYLGESNVQYNGHDGHDYSFPDQLIGTPILAAAPGIAYARTVRGNGVVILHMNGYETVYWHLNSFSSRFDGLVDSNQGVWVETGAEIGTSGMSGFSQGTPHLHFEVRHHGRQVDPYGWYGIGPDPCAAYAGCEASPWLWHESLRGRYDFTPPGSSLRPGAEPDERSMAAVLAVPDVPATPPIAAPPPPDVAPGGTDGDAPPDVDVPGMPASTLPDDGQSTQFAPLNPQPANVQTGADTEPPVGTFSINPPADLLFYVSFDGHILQDVGNGFPIIDATHGNYTFEEGHHGQSVRIPPRGGLTYPISENLRLEAGSISLWAHLPERYPDNGIDRHYILAASANPEDLKHEIYTGTLALRRDLLGTGDTPRWNFWTTPQTGTSERHDLAILDTLDPGWYHFVITWDATTGSKALYLDGTLAASAIGVTLPTDIGDVLEFGRFTAGSRQGGMLFDELAIFSRVLDTHEVKALSRSSAPMSASVSQVYSPTVLLDTNALDTASGIATLQLERNGTFEAPMSYYDAFEWQLPTDEVSHTLGVRYVDRAGNQTHVTRTVALNLPPRGEAVFTMVSPITATLAITVTDRHTPVMMQVSHFADFAGADWHPFVPDITWHWHERTGTWVSDQASAADIPLDRQIDQRNVRVLHIRFRDAEGLVSAPLRISMGAPVRQVYLPLIRR